MLTRFAIFQRLKRLSTLKELGVLIDTLNGAKLNSTLRVPISTQKGAKKDSLGCQNYHRFLAP